MRAWATLQIASSSWSILSSTIAQNQLACENSDSLVVCMPDASGDGGSTLSLPSKMLIKKIKYSHKCGNKIHLTQHWVIVVFSV